MANGTRATSLPAIADISYVLGIDTGGTTGRLSSTALGTVLAASGPIADAITGKAESADLTAATARIDALEELGGTGAQYTAGGPVACATTANITLSGEQTIDGETTSTDRVLVMNQTDPAENGIYVSAAGAWSRATDIDASAEVNGTLISVKAGTANGLRTFVTYSSVETLGSDDIEFREADDASAFSAALALKAPLDSAEPTGDWDFGGADSLTVPDGTADGHAVNKGQLDDAVADIDAVPKLLTTVGRTSDDISESNSLSAFTVALNSPVERAGMVTTFRADCNITGTFTIRVFDRDGDDFTQSGSDTVVNLTAGGVNVITLDTPISVAAGQYLGGYSSALGVITYTNASSDNPFYSVSGDQTSFTDDSAGLTVEIGFDVESDVLTAENMVDVQERVSAIEDVTRNRELVVGYKGTLSIGTAGSAHWYVFDEPVAAAGTIDSITWYRTLGYLTVGVWERHGDTFNKISEAVIKTPTSSGEFSMPVRLRIEKGQYVGVMGSATGAMRYTSPSDTAATPVYVGTTAGDLSSFTDSKPGTNAALQMRLTITIPDLTRTVTVDNSARIIVFGDSYTQSDFTLPGKAWLSLVGERTDFLWENHATSGNTMANRLSVRWTSTYGDIPPLAHGEITYLMSYIGENDDSSLTLSNFDGSMVEFCEIARGVGAVPLIVQQHTDTYSGAATMYFRDLAARYGGVYGSTRGHAYAVDEIATRVTGFQSGAHYGTRNAYIIADEMTRIVNSLPRPKQALKVSRPRSEVTVSTVADLAYATADQRRALWKEINPGQSGLKSAYYAKYDELNEVNYGTDSEITPSEYMPLIQGDGVSCEDYALIEVLLPSADVDAAWFEMGDIDATLYFYDGESEAWFEIIGDGSGEWALPRYILRRGMLGDRLPLLIEKSGAFTLTDPVFRWMGDDVPVTTAPRLSLDRPAGSELLTQTLCGTVGELGDWTTSGTVSVEGSPSAPPRDATSYVTVTDANTIAQAVTVPDSGLEREVEVMVRARFFPAIFDSADTFPDDSDITLDSYDERDLVIMVTVNSQEVPITRPVGLWWRDVRVRVPVGAGHSGLTVEIGTLGASIQIAGASIKTV